ncbi:MAG: hypothetical protein ACI4EN_05400 [Butyrivibrio sp.]
MYREDYNLDIEEINRYRRMSQEEREKPMAEKEKEILDTKIKQRNVDIDSTEYRRKLIQKR